MGESTQESFELSPLDPPRPLRAEGGENETPTVTVRGVYDHDIFSNEENGWTVGVLAVEGRRQLSTIVGNFAASPGETLTLTGSWINNKKFGLQFSVKTCEASSPATLEGLRKYLGSGLIKGIGPVYADRLIERFGLEVPDVIENKPKRLFEVEGIGKKRQEGIVAGWNAQREIKNIMVFLQSYEVGPAFAVKIYKIYGKEAIELVQKNPYRLASDIPGIGFKTADRIATRLGIPTDSPVRAKAALLYSLHQMSEREGHVFVPEDRLIAQTAKDLEIPEASLTAALPELTGEGEGVVFEKREGDSNAVYLSRLHRAEEETVTLLNALLRSPSAAARAVKWDKFFEWYLSQGGLEFSESQKEAIRTAYQSKVTIVTGGPGTGKSTLVKALTTLLSKVDQKFLLASPTGRAAKRMAEVTGLEAKTIHRLLEWDASRGTFKRNQNHPLECDLLIVDEASMLDLPLFYKLLRAVPPHSRLVLVGDIDQLPAVGAGDVLRDLLGSSKTAVVRLTEIYRQSAGSAIIRGAHRIKNGEFPIGSAPGPESASDLFFIEKSDPEACVSAVVSLCKNHIPRKFGFQPLRDLQVLVPMKRGIAGTINLNAQLQSALNPNPVYLERTGKRFSVNDRVIQIRNNYDLEVFNGDIGKVTQVFLEERELVVNFDGREVRYESSNLDELELAYAISIHKSQGSEFPAVIIPLLPQHSIMLQRNLLYTALTRGKKLVIIVGSRSSVDFAVQNSRLRPRYSRLKEKLMR